MVDDPYDEVTRRRIERAGARPAVVPVRRRASASRRAVGGGALLSAVALGLQDVFDPADEEPIVEEIDAANDEDVQPVTLLLVPDAPRLSRALVRPWLL